MGSIDADVLIVSASEGATEATPEAIPGLTDSAVFQCLEAWKTGHPVSTETRSAARWAVSTARPMGPEVALDILVPRIAESIA